jgi:hypothetical protein
MKVRKGLLVMGLAAALMAGTAMVPRADASPRIFVRPGFGFYYGPGSGWYRPWGPYYMYTRPTTGDVKIDKAVKGESIYVDGGFAGVTGKLKKFSLQPGNHLIEIRDAYGHDVYENTVHVMAGETVKINA